MTRKSFCSLDGPHVTACFTYGTWHINLRCNVYSDKLYKSEIKFTRRSIKNDTKAQLSRKYLFMEIPPRARTFEDLCARCRCQRQGQLINTVGCNCLSLPLIPTSGTQVLISKPLSRRPSTCVHYDDVRMGAIASQITSLTIVYSTVYSDADQRKHQSSASLAFVWGIHRDRWIPRTKGQLRGKCFHLMTSSWTKWVYVNSNAFSWKLSYQL